MWYLLWKSYIIQASRQILREVNSEGTVHQRDHKLVWQDHFSFGSSFCWNCGNYNKLKLYGLFTYGTVDSFSRKIIWLEVCRTNSNPMDVEAMYVKVAKSLKLVPEMLRTDHGNETGVMTAAHCRLRQNTDAHRYRISVAKLRIENFWSHFRRTFTSWLVNFFKQMVDEGLLELGNHFYLFLFFRFATNRTKRLCRTLEHTSY